MKQTIKSGELFLCGIFGATLLMLPGLLDLALVPRFVCLSFFIFLVLFFMYKNTPGYHVKADPILMAYVAYAFFCSLSFFWSVNKSEALFEGAKVWLGVFTFLLATYYLTIRGAGFLSALLKLSVCIAAIGALLGIYQLSDLSDFKKESMYLVNGFNAHKNLFSSFLFLNLFFLIMAFIKLPRGWRVASLIMMLMNIGLLGLLRTKAVWVGAGTVVILLVLGYIVSRIRWRTRLRINRYLIAFILVVLTVFFFMKLLSPIIRGNIAKSGEAINTGKTTLDQERLVVWDKTYTMLRKRPITGVGMGNWQIYFPDATLTGLWRVEDLNVTFQRPHNDFLWVLSETGLMGFSLFLFFLFSLFLQAFKNDTNSLGGTMESLLPIVFAAGYFVISMFDFPRERIEHGVWINIILAILYARVQTAKMTGLFSFPVSRPFYLMTGMVFLFFTLIGLLRCKGEYFTRLLYDYKRSNNLSQIRKAGLAAWSFAYTMDPTSVPLHWYTGNANAAMGNYLDAQSDFEKAYRYHPYNRNVINDLASAYAFNKNYPKAKTLYEEAARISPRFDEPKLNLAAIYIEEEDYERAAYWLGQLMHDSERRNQYQKIVELQKANSLKQ